MRNAVIILWPVEVGELEAQMLIRIPNVHFSTSAHFGKPLLAVVLLFVRLSLVKRLPEFQRRKISLFFK